MFHKNHTSLYNVPKMLKICNVKSIDQLIKEVVPINLLNSEKLKIDATENSIKNLNNMVEKNTFYKNYIGLGFNSSILPKNIERNLLNNPNWYSAYTPYQSEISQGRLESLYNFQTLIKSLTNLPVSNASLLDEGSASFEVCNMSHNYHKQKRNKFFCSNDMHPFIIDNLETRTKFLDYEIVIGDFKDINVEDNYSGAMFQYPNTYGNINYYEDLIKELQKNNTVVSCSTDPMSLLLLKSPGELNIDIAFGTCQRFGIPLWYGGPHPAYIGCKSKFLRLMPGRIIGKSIDKYNRDSFRVALQTREQHIKKEKATSNICTSQALLANVASMYVLHHGPDNLMNISKNIHNLAFNLNEKLKLLGIKNKNKFYYDTLHLECKYSRQIYNLLRKNNILIRFIDNNNFIISLNEKTSKDDILEIYNILDTFFRNINTFEFNISYPNDTIDIKINNIKFEKNYIPLKEDIFSRFKTETMLERYIIQLGEKDYNLTTGMMPLGSCTMKLNSNEQLDTLNWKSIQEMHPYGIEQTGYKELIDELERLLCLITGLKKCSFQSNSGAMGENTALLCMKKYHEDNNNNFKTCIIPESAHGTNFTSAILAGFKVIKFKDDISLNDFENLVKNNNVGVLMVTYPSTFGIFEENVKAFCEIVHSYNGLVYMDGANMNAQIGITSPQKIEADACHLNLHKTFCIPHGGGGPGMGPILVNEKLEKYLPGNFHYGFPEKSIGSISSTNYSSAALLSIPYIYISSMGENLTESTKIAILNANYIKDRLKPFYKIFKENKNNRVAHEFIIDLYEFKNLGISDNDISKRLMDYNFHAPTVSWPVDNSLMIEPTDSEDYDEIERVINAMIKIKEEINEIENGLYSKESNVFKNSPHTEMDLLNWNYDYSIEKGCFPDSTLLKHKKWANRNRIDNVYGDKLLIKENS